MNNYETKKRGRPSTLTEAQKVEILRLYKEGKDPNQIAKAADITAGRVVWFLFKNTEMERTKLKQEEGEGVPT